MKQDKPHSEEAKLTPQTRLLIQEEVEGRLAKLPADTYILIERMVEQRVEKVEKMYRQIGVILVLAMTLVFVAFYNITAENASAKASEAIVKSALGQKLKEVEQAHAQIQTTKNQVSVAGAEALDSAVKITAKLQELEKQDNLVRLSHNGNLVFNLQDGEMRLRRRNPDREIILHVDKDGHFKITDATNTLDVLHTPFLLYR